MALSSVPLVLHVRISILKALGGDSTYILGGERLDSLVGRQHNERMLKYFMRDVQIICC